MQADVFRAGQARFDNEAPPEDGICECPECGGTGVVPAMLNTIETDVCPHCNGTGWVDEDGNSVEAPE